MVLIKSNPFGISLNIMVTSKQPRPDKPTPIRLMDLKAPLQMWAMEDDRSLQYLVRKILREAVNKKFGYANPPKKKPY